MTLFMWFKTILLQWLENNSLFEHRKQGVERDITTLKNVSVQFMHM